jgi:hypothetical protein
VSMDLSPDCSVPACAQLTVFLANGLKRSFEKRRHVCD